MKPTSSSSDPRAEVLERAAACVLTDRNASYGEPEDNFGFIAALHTAYLEHRRKALGNTPLTGWDVANMAILTKVARSIRSPQQIDHWVDTAGYAACGFRCATK